MSAVRDKSFQKVTPVNTPKVSQRLDLHVSKVPIVEDSIAEKRKKDFQQKTVFQYSPVSPACQSSLSVPSYSLPSVASEVKHFYQERKVSIGNLVDSSAQHMENESQCLKEQLFCQSFSNPPRISTRERMVESSFSVTSDSSGSCTLARAAPCLNNELCEMAQITFSNYFKGDMYSYIFSRSFGGQETSQNVSSERDSKKDTTTIPIKICSNCSTTASPNWYLAEDKRPLCNACGKFWKRTGTHRPSCHWGRKIKKRTSCNGNRSKRRQKYENLNESFDNALGTQSSMWGNINRVLGNKEEFGMNGPSWDNIVYEQSNETTSRDYYLPNIRIPSETRNNDGSINLTASREHDMKLESTASSVIPLKTEVTLPKLNWEGDNIDNENKAVVDSDVGSSTSFSTRETDCNSLLHAEYSTDLRMSSTSRKSQLFALDDTFAKNSHGRAPWSSRSSIEILALAASKALEKAAPQVA
ncbi:hypothetical protein GpartN1_g3159.t1 [Galdieria partita]|uniref:GATA-type domain-containing protein n=1 Tax=Galdieria partita TaxID=83374 RepID=A0A9C7PV15_9RHOD|nr:hypothetical protein GpartN1_g3159.t1 [Galdieria partita]